MRRTRRSIMWRSIASVIWAAIFGVQAWLLHIGVGWVSDAHWHFYLAVSLITVCGWALIWLLDWRLV